MRSRHSMVGLLVAMIIVLAAWQLRAEDAISAAAQRSGWKFLFDGKTLTGWRGFKQPKPPAGWSVENGLLMRAADAGNLITDGLFENFELSLEYRVSEGASSGVLLRVAETAADPSETSAEVQILDNAADDPQKSGWLVDLFPAQGRWPETEPPVDSTRPVGHWNHLQLLVTKTSCEINLNGIRYREFNLGNEEWKERVAASRFTKYADFAKADKGHLCLQSGAGTVWFRNIRLRELQADGAADDPIDGTLGVRVEAAFPNVQWAGWEPIDDNGLNEPLRPVVFTHAGDGSNRAFVATQQGTIYEFKNEQNVTESKVFLNLRDKVHYYDKENEEGLLGLAFHPRYRETGEFYIYYTARHTPHLSIISRFRVSKDDPEKADPEFEEEILRIQQPFWNHNGGTLAFGSDGYLYIGMGDGGSANDPLNSGQDLNTLLGKILRIDVDHKSGGKAYEVPADNPFVGRENAKPEVYAFGFRNIWRMAFDRKTHELWAADVGQNLWEEIDLVQKGGNYGWSLREATHPFGARLPEEGVILTDPIWEYDHQVGKSITGGCVYRGKLVPELIGKYLYADYVTGKIWALDYDAKARRVRGNYRLKSPMLPIITFGEDEQGEVYFAIVAPDGKGLFRFASEK